MSGKLVGEVVEWLRTPAAEGLSQAERVVLFVVAERANPETREMWRHRTDTESLHERIRGALDVSAGALGNVFGRLAKRGLEVRIPTGVDKRGKPTFANNGHSTRFRLPEFSVSATLQVPERSIDGWTFPVENRSDQPVDNPTGDHVKVHQPMDLHEERSTNGWSFEGERSIDGWTVDPSKDNPSKTESPSTPVLAVGELTVRTARAAEAPSAQPGDLFQARSVITGIARYGKAPLWVRRDHLIPLAAAALAAGFHRDTITHYAQMVITEARFAEHQHIPEFRDALRRLGRDTALGDLAPTVQPTPDTDAPWTDEDQAAWERVLDELGVTPDDLDTTGTI
ncbi:hypothetical protein [Streptosporangium sp. NPDC006007]|uniref:hypothetical protein n=1 Tax=Streptosporangium sp. NPDC006007 TaxID=3154575 RepID=UPI0033A20011